MQCQLALGGSAGAGAGLIQGSKGDGWARAWDVAEQVHSEPRLLPLGVRVVPTGCVCGWMWGGAAAGAAVAFVAEGH